MKAWKTVVKIAVAVSAVAGAVYLAATYGDRVVAWAKKLIKGSCECECECEDCDCECECGCDCDCECEAEAEAEATDEAVAEQADFEG